MSFQFFHENRPKIYRIFMGADPDFPDFHENENNSIEVIHEFPDFSLKLTSNF